MVSERLHPRQEMVASDWVGISDPRKIPSRWQSVTVDRPYSFSGYGGAPVDRPYSFSGYGGAPADRPSSLSGYGGAPAVRPSSLSGYGGAPAVRPSSLSGYGGGLDRRSSRSLPRSQLAADGIGLGEGSGPQILVKSLILDRSVKTTKSMARNEAQSMAFDLTAARRRMMKSMVRYEEDATDPTAIWRIVHLRPSVEPRHIPDRVPPAKLKNEKTRRTDDLRKINMRSTPEGNFNPPPTGYSAVPDCWGQSQLPHAFVATPTLNKLNTNSESELARQWDSNPRNDRAPSFFKSLAKGPILDSPEIVGGKPLVEALDSPEIVGGEPLVEAVVQKKESTMKSFTPGDCKYCRGKGFLEHKCKHYQQVNLMAGVSKDVVPEQGEFGIPSWLFGLSLPDAVDLAVLEMDSPTDLLKPVNVGQSSALRVGQQCLAMGNPFGSDHILTAGVISGLNRDIFSKAGAQFHRKQGAFLHNLEAQTLPKSLHCNFIRLTLEYFKYSSLDSYEFSACKMKLLYFCKCCADNEAINIWNKNHLKGEVGNVSSKHLVLALKVKSVLDLCVDNNVNCEEDNMSLDNESDQDDDFFDTEVRPSEVDCYIIAPNDGNYKGHSGTISEEDTQDAVHEEELTALVRERRCSRDIGTVDVSDVLSNFPDISIAMVEDIMERDLVQIADPAAIEAMDKKNNNCNLSVIAHVDHGKSTLTDSLVAAAGIIVQEVAGDVSKTDTRVDEAKRGITIKFTGISLFYEMTEVSLMSYKNKMDGLDEKLLRLFASGSRAVLNPMTAMLGGSVGQEIMKACSRKLHPNYQFFYFDSVESPLVEPLEPGDLTPESTRYAAQISVFGSKLRKKLEQAKVFMGGFGALGCEFLKNLALMGASYSPDGKLTVTDDDIMEKSNLNRQFLFHDWNSGQPKSTVAATVVMAINLKLHVEAFQNRAGPETENVCNDAFWKSLDVVINALGIVTARMYIDSRCVYFQKPLPESGSLGAKCNTQMIIPHLTENHGASSDPPEKQAHMCTVHSFPHNIDHCLTWARFEYEGLLEKTPTEVNAFLSNPTGYAVASRTARDQLECVIECFHGEKCETFQDCIAWIRLKFEDYLSSRVKQLKFTFPEDSMTNLGAPSRSAPKRFPRPPEFTPTEPSQLNLVLTASILRAETFVIPIPYWAFTLSSFTKIFASKFGVDDIYATAIRNCGPEGSHMWYDSKMIPTSDNGRFFAFIRVFSRKVAIDKKDLYVESVQSTEIWMGKTQESVEYVLCGSIVAIVGLNQFITNSANLTNEKETDACPIRTMEFFVFPVVCVAVQCQFASDFPKLVDSLKRLAKPDLMILCDMGDSGEHSIAGAGELYLKICLKVLLKMLHGKMLVSLKVHFQHSIHRPFALDFLISILEDKYALEGKEMSEPARSLKKILSVQILVRVIGNGWDVF